MHGAFALEGTECISDRGSCVIGVFGSVPKALSNRRTELDDHVGDRCRISGRVRLIDGQGVNLHIRPTGGVQGAPNNIGRR